MTDDNDFIKRIEVEDDDESVFARAVASGDIEDINEAVNHIDELTDKREQALDLRLMGAKSRLDDEIESAQTELEALQESADSDLARRRAAALAGMTKGANIQFESLAESEPGDGETGGYGTTRQSDSLTPPEREKKIERLSESVREAESLGFDKAAAGYRETIRELRRD